jgi:hypothetical protein
MVVIRRQQYVRFTPESGHYQRNGKESAYDPKRTSAL